jgi:hypothetical protein
MKELYGVATVTAALIATILLLGNSQTVVAALPTGVKNVVLVHGAFAEAVADILLDTGESCATIERAVPSH